MDEEITRTYLRAAAEDIEDKPRCDVANEEVSLGKVAHCIGLGSCVSDPPLFIRMGVSATSHFRRQIRFLTTLTVLEEYGLL